VAEAETALRDSARHGRPACVVNVSSHAGVRPKGASIPYAASKAALNHVTRLLAVSLAPDIRVNAVAPGFIGTDMVGALDEKVQNTVLTMIPVGRFGKPDEIASAVTFLASPGASYITGTVINASGGLYM